MSGTLWVGARQQWKRDLKNSLFLLGCAPTTLVSIPLLYILRYPVKDPAYQPTGLVRVIDMGWSHRWDHCWFAQFSIKLYQKDLDKFEGPSTGVYRLSPPQLRWRNRDNGWSLVASLPSITRVDHVCYCLDGGFIMLCCILLFEASVRVERGARKYGGQIKYEKWKEVPVVCLPRVAPYSPLLGRLVFKASHALSWFLWTHLFCQILWRYYLQCASYRYTYVWIHKNRDDLLSVYRIYTVYRVWDLHPHSKLPGGSNDFFTPRLLSSIVGPRGTTDDPFHHITADGTKPRYRILHVDTDQISRGGATGDTVVRLRCTHFDPRYDPWNYSDASTRRKGFSPGAVHLSILYNEHQLRLIIGYS
jgi:hypothetical protein